MKNIALIFGGEGAEAEISVSSAANVYTYIDKSKYCVLPIFIARDGEWWLTDRVTDTPQNSKSVYPVRYKGLAGLLCNDDVIPVDAAIPVLHGDFGEDGKIQGALDTAHISYVGCGVASSAACADKILTKTIANGIGIPTAEWMWHDGDTEAAKLAAEAKLGYPMFIKPTSLGSSIGANQVKCANDFAAAYNYAHKYGRVLIEQLIPVEYEVECALLQINKTTLINPSGTIPTGGKFYDFNTKYGIGIPNITSHGGGDSCVKSKIADYALKLCDVIGVRHMARADFFVTRDGDIYFNEINTVPGMTATSLYPTLAEGMGFARGEFINRLIAEICV